MTNASRDYTAGEENNIELAKEYMLIAYDPKRASARNVQHLCAPDNRFIAPSTFPDIHTRPASSPVSASIRRRRAGFQLARP